MGEAIIASGGRTNDGSPKMEWVEFTEIITENKEYTIPECRNQEIEVFLVGGGGGSSNQGGNYNYGYAGGGGGYYNRNIVQVAPGSIVSINIGSGGSRNGSGGTTKFGPYLSAAGAYSSGSSGGGGFVAIEPYQEQSGSSGYLQLAHWARIGSGGGNFGGGGGGALIARLHVGAQQSGCLCEAVSAGSGGKYGGGGGGAGWFSVNTRSSTWGWFNAVGYSTSGRGGEFGGNGGYIENNTNKIANDGNNGTNTIGWTNVERYILNNNIFFTGEGKGSNSTGYANSNYEMKFIGAAGAGGGFGGNGGLGQAGEISYYSAFYSAGGGGGGYGADGGRGMSSYSYCSGGGGGGWGDNGGNAGPTWGGYGGGYGPAGYGRGGSSGGGGQKGICILKYQKLIYV